MLAHKKVTWRRLEAILFFIQSMIIILFHAVLGQLFLHLLCLIHASHDIFHVNATRRANLGNHGVQGLKLLADHLHALTGGMDLLVDIRPVRAVKLSIAGNPLHAVQLRDRQEHVQVWNLADIIQVNKAVRQLLAGHC